MRIGEDDSAWGEQLGIRVRAIPRNVADQTEAAIAAAWDALAARGPASETIPIEIANTEEWESVPTARMPGGAPVYKTDIPHSDPPALYLYLAANNHWHVGTEEDMRGRRWGGRAVGNELAHTTVAVDNGTPPSRVPKEQWWFNRTLW